MINYIKQDLTKLERGIIAHGVNCQGVMGAGVAGAIKSKWPVVYDRYMEVGKTGSNLGMIDIVTITPDELYVVNCYTQDFYGRRGRYAVPNAIIECLDLLLRFAECNREPLPVYMPKIGCGLGGLNWDADVEPIVDAVALKHPGLTIYVCDPLSH